MKEIIELDVLNIHVQNQVLELENVINISTETDTNKRLNNFSCCANKVDIGILCFATTFS